MSKGGATDAGARTVLALNAGSSSLKLALFSWEPRPRRLVSGAATRVGQPGAAIKVSFGGAAPEEVRAEIPDHRRALELLLARLGPLLGSARVAAAGHRFVHGGSTHDRAQLVNRELVSDLHRLAALDPSHLPAEIAILEEMVRRAPGVPQVACFDTAFHATMPAVARRIAIPRRYELAGVRRYGFHGLSYTYLMEELGRVAGEKAARGRVVLAHLGSGASLAAVRDGRCIDTTMGFTPASGIPMSTRTGDLDPGVVLYWLRDERLSIAQIDDLIHHRSGLLGVSETSGDMAELLAREPVDPRAAGAVELFCYRAKKAVGALAAALGGIDTLVFSGGIGEHAASIRARIACDLSHLGIEIDPARNRAHEGLISSSLSSCAVRVLHTDEESIVARDTVRVLEARELLRDGGGRQSR
jgi:acetate kinase